MMDIENSYNKNGFLSGSTLKIIACVLMAIDHIGLELLNDYLLFRIIGRLAFPLFAFFIAEGCRYTKNKVKRFLTLFAIGALFGVFYFFYGGQIYGNIFMTFSVSVLYIYLLEWSKKQLFCSESLINKVGAVLIFLIALACGYFVFEIVHFEYGFCGMLVPVFTSLFDFKNIPVSDTLKHLDTHWLRIISFTLGLIPLCIWGRMTGIQFFCLISVLFVLFYNGKVGNKKLKYAFYFFYPVHLVIIEGIALLINYL